MRNTRTSSIASTLCALILWLAPSVLSATEFGATYLVFEKTTKMKKVSVPLLMSFLDQSEKGDTIDTGRRLRCAAQTFGNADPVTPKGRFVVRLLGQDGGASWESREFSGALDDRGEVVFEDDAIASLVAEAGAAEPELFQIEFDGAKGPKVAHVSIECIHEREDG